MAITEDDIKNITLSQLIQLARHLTLGAWLFLLAILVVIFQLGSYYGSKNNGASATRISGSSVTLDSTEVLKQRIKNAEEKQRILKEINDGILFGKNIYAQDGGGLRSSYVYVTSEMKELRNSTLMLMESLGLQDTALYKETAKEIEIGIDPDNRSQFALKLKYIDQNIAGLKTLRRLVEAVDFKNKKSLQSR